MSDPNTKTSQYLFTLTSFSQDADGVATPLVLANSALAAGNDVLLWLTMEGVQLAKAGAADEIKPRSFAPVSELLDTYIQGGGRIGVCPPCGKTHGVTDQNMVKNAEWMGAAALIAAMSQRQTLSF